MKDKKSSKIVNIITTIILCFIVYKAYGIYKTHTFNEFTKAERNMGITKFTRDKETTYTYKYSYKLESNDFNDAMFYKKINVKPNTPYKLSCFVKTENIEAEDKKSNSGAQISVLNSTESSKSLTGTNDWQKLEFLFDSKNRDEIQIGFRLGGNESNVKGTAWFSDFKLEEGIKDNSSNWNVVCFIMDNLDVTINNENLKITMSNNDIDRMKENMDRFKIAMQEMSNNKMTVNYDIYEINEPIKTITYSDEYGYYIDPMDVKDLIGNYLYSKEYDYIFVATKLGDIDSNIEIPVNDWIGLRRNGFIWYRLFKYKATK